MSLELSIAEYERKIKYLEEEVNILQTIKNDFTYLVNAVTEGVCIVSYDTQNDLKYIFISDNVLKIIGRPKSYLDNGINSWYDIVHPSDKDIYLSHTKKIFSKKVNKSVAEYRIFTDWFEIKWLREEMHLRQTTRNTYIIHVVIKDITQEVSFERKYSDSKTKLDSLINQSIDGIAIINENGFISEWNDAMYKISGKKPSEAIGRYIWDIMNEFYPINDKDRIFKRNFKGNTLDFFRKGTKPVWFNQRFDNEFIAMDGERKWIESIFFPIQSSFGQQLCLIIRDITQKKEAESRLISSELNYRDLVENANSIILRWSLKGEILFLNEYGQEYFGVKQEDVIGKHVMGTIVPEKEVSGRDLRNLMKKICDNTENYQININENIKSNGEKSWVLWTNKVIRNDKNEIIEIYSVGTDITDRKNSEEALRESEEKFRKLNENSVVGVYIVQNDLIRYSNPALANIFGYDLSDLNNSMRFSNLIHPDDRGLIEKNNKRQLNLENLEYSNYTLRGLKKTGELLYIQVFGSITIYKGKPALIGHLLDITEQKLAEQELQLARQKALSATESKSQFLAKMSHEVRTPMNGIVGAAEYLKSLTLNPEQKEFVELISRSASNLITIVNEILDFSKIESGQIELESINFSLHDLLKDVIQLVQFKANEKYINLNCNIDQKIPRQINGDPVRIRQVLLNLINNAVKFTEEGSVNVNVKLKESKGTKHKIRFEVQDTGIGISPDKIDKVFDEFVQAEVSTTRKYGGSGLGLSIAKMLVERMGGLIQVESKINVGTHFWFEIEFNSFVTFKDDEAIFSEIKEKEIVKKSLNVLLVEDNPINQKVAQNQLKNLGHFVQVADNGEIAVAKFKDAETDFDIIFMDIQMPVMDGIEATKQIKTYCKETGKSCYIIALTANTMRFEREQYINAGLDEFVGKPYKLSDLDRIIKLFFPA